MKSDILSLPPRNSLSHQLAARTTRAFLVLAWLGFAAALAACVPLVSARPSAAAARARLEVEEYPLVEQSKDNPDHPDFLNHLPSDAIEKRSSWRSPTPQSDLLTNNRVLADFGYRLETTATVAAPSFSLYAGQKLVLANISGFEPVTLNADGDDFLLPVVTPDGEWMAATTSGLNAWPGFDNTPGGDRLAYAQLAGMGTNLVWESGGGSQGLLHTQTIAGKPFVIYAQGGLVYIKYGDQALPNVYDRVLTGDGPAGDLFAPGGNVHMVWFYALRDGLWYYVEAGIYD